MLKEEILNNAKYILFPYNNEYYASWLVDNYNEAKTAVKMPIIKNENNILYSNMPKNEHHYTTYYHRTYVLPELAKLLNFNFNLNDFNIINNITKTGDVSYLYPKKDISYTIYSFNRNIVENCKYIDLMPINICPDNCYRYLYKYFHECSRIINNDLHNGRKLFISGDSQTIPDILPLTIYFEEVWYMDNRTGQIWNNNTHTLSKDIDKQKLKSFSDKYKNIIFTDVLIELYTNPMYWYQEINLY